MSRVQVYWTRFGLPLSIAVAFLSVAVLALTTFRNTVALRDGEKEVSRSHAIGEAIHRLLSALKDMQGAERGFLITGRRVFLGPYEVGKKELEQSWQELGVLAKSDGRLSNQVVDLRAFVDKKVSYLESALKLRNEHPSETISADLIEVVKSEGGERLMDSVRDAAEKILAEQADLLSADELRSSQLSQTSYRAIVLGNLISLAMITFSGAISIWDRRRRDASEASLAAKESELTAIFDSTSDAVISFDDLLHVRLMNPAAREVLRIANSVTSSEQSILELLKPNESTDWSVHQFIHSEDRVRNVSGTGIRFDGSQFPMEGRFTKIDSDGKRYNILLFQDLTQIHGAEASRRQLAAVVDQVTDAIVVCDLDGKIVTWNHGAVALHGFSSEQAIGRDAKDLMCVDSPNTWELGSKQILSRPLYTTVFEMTQANKQKVWIEHRRSLIRDSIGKPIGQLVMHIDITERRREEAKQRRSQRLESIGTLAGGVAHDLNNILTPILMNAKLAMRPTDNQARLLEVIVTSAERGGKMIKKLLAFAGGESASLESVNVRNVIHEVEDILKHSLPKTIQLTIDVDENLQIVKADPTELGQVLVNLAINARDAMPDGGNLTIEAKNYQVSSAVESPPIPLSHDRYVLLSVRDEGHGISSEILERIFDPFFTTKAQGKGTGLGLATSLGIIRSYGGDITVESQVGEGSVFKVWIPSSDEPVEHEVECSLETELPQGKGETILVVDDEPNILEAAEELLKQNGYRVICALGGQEAVRKFSLSSGKIDLVVLDMMMPELDGLETKRLLRASEPSIKIVGSSGLRNPKLNNELKDLDDFLPKPYSNLEMLRTVRNTLDASPNKAK